MAGNSGGGMCNIIEEISRIKIWGREDGASAAKDHIGPGLIYKKASAFCCGVDIKTSGTVYESFGSVKMISGKCVRNTASDKVIWWIVYGGSGLRQSYLVDCIMEVPACAGMTRPFRGKKEIPACAGIWI
ncbi:MAG: hypothetical protein V4708_17675 [Bacteroidota bacterium]